MVFAARTHSLTASRSLVQVPPGFPEPLGCLPFSLRSQAFRQTRVRGAGFSTDTRAAVCRIACGGRRCLSYPPRTLAFRQTAAGRRAGRTVSLPKSQRSQGKRQTEGGGGTGRTACLPKSLRTREKRQTGGGGAGKKADRGARVCQKASARGRCLPESLRTQEKRQTEGGCGMGRGEPAAARGEPVPGQRRVGGCARASRQVARTGDCGRRLEPQAKSRARRALGRGPHVLREGQGAGALRLLPNEPLKDAGVLDDAFGKSPLALAKRHKEAPRLYSPQRQADRCEEILATGRKTTRRQTDARTVRASSEPQPTGLEEAPLNPFEPFEDSPRMILFLSGKIENSYAEKSCATAGCRPFHEQGEARWLPQ